MALLIFYRNSSLFSSPVHSKHETLRHRQHIDVYERADRHWERESARGEGVKKKEEKEEGEEEEKKPRKVPLRRDRDSNSRPHEYEPSTLSIRPRRHAHAGYLRVLFLMLLSPVLCGFKRLVLSLFALVTNLTVSSHGIFSEKKLVRPRIEP